MMKQTRYIYLSHCVSSSFSLLNPYRKYYKMIKKQDAFINENNKVCVRFQTYLYVASHLSASLFLIDSGFQTILLASVLWDWIPFDPGIHHAAMSSNFYAHRVTIRAYRGYMFYLILVLYVLLVYN